MMRMRRTCEDHRRRAATFMEAVPSSLLHVTLFLFLLSSGADAFAPSSIHGGSSRTSTNLPFVQPPSLPQNPYREHRRQLHKVQSSAEGRHDDTSLENGGKAPPFSVTLEGEDYSYQDAIQRTLGWVGAAITFGGCLWSLFGSATGEEFFAGYLVEQSLSVDNLFVFLLLFEYFKVPLPYQDRVLNWGIYGAVVMRAIMIGVGAAAIHNFHAILLVFAGILVYSSGKVLLGGDEEEEDPGENSIVKFSRSLINSTDQFDGDRFFTIVDGVRKATPLFICMIAVEISDIVFAVDSIPAVFGVTENPLIVFSSNIFAIMGLRSLYTILSKAATDLKYLEPAVALVLGFIGAKMVLEYLGYMIPTSIALSVVASFLTIGVGASVWDKQREMEEEDAREGM